jgi:hypothetical protein
MRLSRFNGFHALRQNRWNGSRLVWVLLHRAETTVLMTRHIELHRPGESRGLNDNLQRHQKFRDIERCAWAAEFTDVAGPFPPLFCAVIERALHLRENFPWGLGKHT